MESSSINIKQSITVVVPVYNSYSTLVDLIERLRNVLSSLTVTYEIILVNDGSRDNSWDIICELARQDPAVRGINLMRNYGQHNALLCGIRMASYDVIVTMDDDLQHPPEEIPKLLEKLNDGYDVVYGKPQQEQHGFWRDLASQLIKKILQKAMGTQIASNISAFRVFRTQVREAFMTYQGPFVSLDVLLTWGTTRYAALPIKHHPRLIGTSNYTIAKLIIHTFNLMTGFSILPLRLAGLIGFAFTLFGMSVLIYVVGRYLIQGSVAPGFPFLASIIAIFSGAQLFALAIIGEYLARIHFRTMTRPTYTVRSTTFQETSLHEN